jgi:hypothetical protein
MFSSLVEIFICLHEKIKKEKMMVKRTLALALCLSLILVISIPLGVTAASATDTSVVTAAITGTLELSVTNDFNFGTLTLNDNNEHVAAIVASVATNTSYSLTVDDSMIKISGVDKPLSAHGCLWNGLESSSLVLHTPLKVRGGDVVSFAPLSNSVTLLSNSTNASTSIDLQQPVTPSDSPSPAYQITLVFTASYTP